MITFSHAQVTSPPVDPPDETNSFLIWFDDTWTLADIIEFKNDFNSWEHWESPLTRTKYWQIDSFPFTLPNGVVVTNINQSGQNANDRIGQNGGAGQNVVVLEISAQGPPSAPPAGTAYDPQMDCQGAHPPYVEGGNGQHVNLGVFDTGISEQVMPISGYYWDFNGMTEYNYIDNNGIARDNNGHGTAMATIASHVSHKTNKIQNGTSANISINKIAKIIGASGSGLLAETLYGFEESVMNGTQVANCSFGFTADYQTAMDHPFARSIEFARDQYGTLVVASAGNNSMNYDFHPYSDLNFPACYPYDNVLSVTSYDCNGQFTNVANYGGGHIDVAAPGYYIGHQDLNGQLTYSSGTSHSTAIVSGLAAALGTHLQSNTPIFDYATVKCAIMEGSTFESSIVDNGLVASGGVIHGEGALAAMFNGCVGGSNGPSGTGGPGGVGGVSKGRSLDITSEVYPNPSNGIVNVSIGSGTKEVADVKIYDAFGQLIFKNSYQIEEGSNDLQLDVELSSGQYHLNVFTKNQVQKHKLMIIK